MRTTVNLDDRAVEEAIACAEGLTMTEVINEALRLFSRGRRQKALLALRGNVDWEGDLDQLRKRELPQDPSARSDDPPERTTT